jgi:hypothetical protein
MAGVNDVDEPDVLDLAGPKPSDGVGLCLSGGGYRAMLFHLGTLRRLNETGWLRRLTHVSSVSGGSITAARLGMVWDKLEFGAGGVAANFGALVERAGGHPGTEVSGPAQLGCQMASLTRSNDSPAAKETRSACMNLATDRMRQPRSRRNR